MENINFLLGEKVLIFLTTKISIKIKKVNNKVIKRLIFGIKR